VWIRQIATASDVQIVPPQPGSPDIAVSITPDGNFVDYVRFADSTRMALWRVSFLGGVPQKMLDDVHTSVGVVARRPAHCRRGARRLRRVGADCNRRQRQRRRTYARRRWYRPRPRLARP
jgi:hypothetical protein